MKKAKKMDREPLQPILAIIVIFLLCTIFHYVETFAIRTDETLFADNFINKVLGIAVLAVSIRRFHYTWKQIGFQPARIKYVGYGLALGLLCFTVAYAVEYFILYYRSLSPVLEWYVSGFSLTGVEVKQTGALAFLLCIALNVINVVMEEGVFRGLFIRLGMVRMPFVQANWLAAALFGLWHLSMPIRSVVDGQMAVGEAALLGIGYVFLATLMGVKWGLWLRNTGCLWFGIGEHFFNNTIGNMLHVSSGSGSDELQIVRILIAQMLSLAITLLVNRKWRGDENEGLNQV